MAVIERVDTILLRTSRFYLGKYNGSPGTVEFEGKPGTLVRIEGNYLSGIGFERLSEPSPESTLGYAPKKIVELMERRRANAGIIQDGRLLLFRTKDSSRNGLKALEATDRVEI